MRKDYRWPEVACDCDISMSAIRKEKAIDETQLKECRNCKHWGCVTCPNSSECYALANKPHFEAATNETCSQLLDKMHTLVDKLLQLVENGKK